MDANSLGWGTDLLGLTISTGSVPAYRIVKHSRNGSTGDVSKQPKSWKELDLIMSDTKSPLVLVPCPVCGCDEVRLANIVKLVPSEGKPNSSYPITIFADNRVVLDENSMPVTDFVGCRLAVGLECADGHLWSLIFLEHLGRLYTTVPVQHSS